MEYEPFYQDFGPLNLGKTWKYVTELEKLLRHPDYLTNQIYHYTSTDYAKCANSAYLMGAYQIIIMGYSAEKAFEPFSEIKFVPFRDASYGECSYKCTVTDPLFSCWTACEDSTTPSSWAGSTTRSSISASTSTMRELKMGI